MNGTQICVSVPGKPLPAQNITGTQITTITNSNGTSTITSAAVAAVPTNVAKQTELRCGQYYTTVEGDYCNVLLMKFAISLVDFFFLNKDVNANCTNLLAQYSYCVKSIGDIKSSSMFLRLSLMRPSQYVYLSSWICQCVIDCSQPDA